MIISTAFSGFRGLIFSQDLEVRRRYSEFASLRQTLVNLHPTLVVPPIPEKHTMADYACEADKSKRGRWHHRAPETDACGLPQPV